MIIKRRFPELKNGRKKAMKKAITKLPYFDRLPMTVKPTAERTIPPLYEEKIFSNHQLPPNMT